MKVKHLLILLGVALALVSAAAIGVILPENYPMPEPVQPQDQPTVPVASDAPVPVAPEPGHPGGMYTQLTATCYGPIKIYNITVTSADVNGTGHVGKDGLSAWIDFACDTRQTATVNISVKQNDGRDVNTIYITAATEPGVEISLSPISGTLKHILPGTWVGATDSNGWLNISIDIYGQPIDSGVRYITVKFTAE